MFRVPARRALSGHGPRPCIREHPWPAGAQRGREVHPAAARHGPPLSGIGTTPGARRGARPAHARISLPGIRASRGAQRPWYHRPGVHRRAGSLLSGVRPRTRGPVPRRARGPEGAEAGEPLARPAEEVPAVVRTGVRRIVPRAGRADQRTGHPFEGAVSPPRGRSVDGRPDVRDCDAPGPGPGVAHRPARGPSRGEGPRQPEHRRDRRMPPHLRRNAPSGGGHGRTAPCRADGGRLCRRARGPERRRPPPGSRARLQGGDHEPRGVHRDLRTETGTCA